MLIVCEPIERKTITKVRRVKSYLVSNYRAIIQECRLLQFNLLRTFLSALNVFELLTSQCLIVFEPFYIVDLLFRV